MVLWALNHLGPFPATSVTSPACHCPHCLPQHPGGGVSSWKTDYSQLCSVPRQKSLAVLGREEDLPWFRGDLCRSSPWLCLLLLQTPPLQPRRAKPARTLLSHPSTALPTPLTPTTTPSQSTGPSRAHPKVTNSPWAGRKGNPFLLHVFWEETLFSVGSGHKSGVGLRYLPR